MAKDRTGNRVETTRRMAVISMDIVQFAKGKPVCLVRVPLTLEIEVHGELHPHLEHSCEVRFISHVTPEVPVPLPGFTSGSGAWFRATCVFSGEGSRYISFVIPEEVPDALSPKGAVKRRSKQRARSVDIMLNTNETAS